MSRPTSNASDTGEWKGPDHPLVAMTLGGFAEVLRRAGDDERAAAYELVRPRSGQRTLPRRSEGERGASAVVVLRTRR